MKYRFTGFLSTLWIGVLSGLFAVSVYGQLSVYYPEPFSNSRYVTVDGLELHYRQWRGDEETPIGNVLLVHGFSGSAYSWQKVADSLYQLGYHVVAVDVPPFGYSDRNPLQNQSVTFRADLLHHFLQKQFGALRWHLAGHSMGGAIVQAMALKYPECYESTAFVAATLFEMVKPGDKDARLLFRFPGVTCFLGNIAEHWFINRASVGRLLESALGQEPSQEEVKHYYQPLVIPGTARAVLNSERFSSELYQLHVSQMKVPAFAVWGDKDTWVPLQSRKAVAKQMPGLELKVISGAGHNPMETHLEEFVDSYHGFLRDL